MGSSVFASAAGALAVLLLSVYLLGRAHEARSQAEDRLGMQAEIAAERARADEAELQRLIEQAERERLAMELENAAFTDADADRVSLPARSVQRLGSR